MTPVTKYEQLQERIKNAFPGVPQGHVLSAIWISVGEWEVAANDIPSGYVMSYLGAPVLKDADLDSGDVAFRFSVPTMPINYIKHDMYKAEMEKLRAENARLRRTLFEINQRTAGVVP